VYLPDFYYKAFWRKLSPVYSFAQHGVRCQWGLAHKSRLKRSKIRRHLQRRPPKGIYIKALPLSLVKLERFLGYLALLVTKQPLFIPFTPPKRSAYMLSLSFYPPSILA
jgi:hypothetical protein